MNWHKINNTLVSDHFKITWSGDCFHLFQNGEHVSFCRTVEEAKEEAARLMLADHSRNQTDFKDIATSSFEDGWRSRDAYGGNYPNIGDMEKDRDDYLKSLEGREG